jgi:hypothetical protein
MGLFLNWALLTAVFKAMSRVKPAEEQKPAK